MPSVYTYPRNQPGAYNGERACPRATNKPAKSTILSTKTWLQLTQRSEDGKCVQSDAGSYRREANVDTMTDGTSPSYFADALNAAFG